MKFCTECGLKLGLLNRSGYCKDHKPKVKRIVITPHNGSPVTTITIKPKR